MKKSKILIFLSLFAMGFFFNNVNSLAKEVKFSTDFEKKYVTVKIHYDINFYDIGDYWYSDGVYSGWLYKREATITGDFTNGYDVIYIGYVIKGPFVPNKANVE